MKKKKVLFVATVVKTHIMTFHLPFLKMFQEMGYETAVAARNDYEIPEECTIPYCDTFYNIPFERSPLKKQNIQAYIQLKKIIEEEKYDLIHCHTPVGGVIARLAAKNCRKHGTKVLYTAHGFHFYKGAPLKNWLIYYPIEKFCSHFTDMLITINREDYDFAKRKMKAEQIEYVPGVGIDTERFRNSTGNREEKRAALGIPDDAFLMISVGELNLNKNHQAVLRAMSLLNDPAIHYAIAGIGDQRETLLSLAEELGLSDRVHLLGYRNDIVEIYHAADLFVFPSYREGLPVALMEAMASGLPCVVSDIRGNRDLIDNNGGILFNPHCIHDIQQAVLLIRHSDTSQASKYNAEKIQNFGTETIIRQMHNIYNHL